jgi:glucosamine--fructose-6-phosphate aminotransferase (isomerizing)
MRQKLAGIAAFASQRQIGAVVEAQRAAGPREYLQRADWKPYSPALYSALFSGASADAGKNFASDCARIIPLLAAWPEQPWEPLRAAFAESGKTPLLIVGEGSSRLFPAAIACALARLSGGALHVEHLGGREASALDLKRWQVLAMSNSGKTREVIEAVEPLTGQPGVLGAQPREEKVERVSAPTMPEGQGRRHALLALVGQPGGPLQKLVPTSRALLDAPETTVAATVSVFAQALALAHAAAAAAGLPVPLAALREACPRALTAEPPIDAAALARVRRVWWSGAESGCAGELTLKTMETSGCIGVHLPGSMVLHGIEEVLDEHDLVVAFDPAREDLDSLKTRIGATGARLLRITSTGAGGDWELPGTAALGPDWSAFPQLCAGWRLLSVLARALGRDPDKPRRARKVGNEYQGKAGKAGG